MKRLLLALMLIFALSANAEAAKISVPDKVSQGHAFPVSVTDGAPFDVRVRWRGETLLVRAGRAAEQFAAEDDGRDDGILFMNGGADSRHDFLPLHSQGN